MSYRLRMLCARASWAAEMQAAKQSDPLHAMLASQAVLARWHAWAQRHCLYRIQMC